MQVRASPSLQSKSGGKKNTACLRTAHDILSGSTPQNPDISLNLPGRQVTSYSRLQVRAPPAGGAQMGVAKHRVCGPPPPRGAGHDEGHGGGRELLHDAHPAGGQADVCVPEDQAAGVAEPGHGDQARLHCCQDQPMVRLRIFF